MRALAAAVAIVVGCLLVPAGAAGADAASTEQAFVASINRLRADRGLPALRVHPELTGIARRWAGEMADAGAISHNPGFSGEVTADWRKLGENVGRGPDVEDLMRAFVASPTHLANLVDGEFTLIGVGVVERHGELWTSHQLMVLFDEPAPAPPAPAPPAPSPDPPAPAPVPPAPAPVAVAAVTAPAPVTPPSPDRSVPAPAPGPAGVETSAIPGVLTSLRLLDA